MCFGPTCEHLQCLSFKFFFTGDCRNSYQQFRIWDVRKVTRSLPACNMVPAYCAGESGWDTQTVHRFFWNNFNWKNKETTGVSWSNLKTRLVVSFSNGMARLWQPSSCLHHPSSLERQKWKNSPCWTPKKSEVHVENLLVYKIRFFNWISGFLVKTVLCGKNTHFTETI